MSADCEEKHYFVCQSTPLDKDADNDCPRGFFWYKGSCISAHQETVEYENAEVWQLFIQLCKLSLMDGLVTAQVRRIRFVSFRSRRTGRARVSEGIR